MAWALALSACAAEDEPGVELVPVYDLAARLAAADVAVEPRSIAFDSAEGRRPLRSGWSRGERDGRGRPFAWAVGSLSTLDVHVLEPRDLELLLEGRPFRYPGAPRQAVTVAVNGHRIGEIELEPELATYRLLLPGQHLVAGTNRLELGYRWNRSPRELALSDDSRRLSAAWYEIRFGASEEPELPSAPSGSDQLNVPFGSQVDYYLEVPTGSELRVERWLVRGSGRLEIGLQEEHAEPLRLATVDGPDAPTALRLPSGATGPVRLSLRAIASPGAGGAGGVGLSRPAVWSPREDRPEAPGPLLAAEGGEAAPRPNVVVYLIDTLRADRLGCYGYPRPVSPRIDAFAERAVLFEHVVAQSSWTRAAVASIFTGQWPLAHGTNGRSDRLSAAADTLAERLRAAGYRTAALVTNPNVTTDFGFDQGFDDFSYLGEETGSDGVHRAAVEWLDRQPAGEPFFLYLHTLDPHAPYRAPATYSRRLAPAVDSSVASRSLDLLNDLQAKRIEASAALAADLQALYDAEIAFNDDSFGALLDALEARGLADGALIILVSDHGEEFHEHGNWQHGRALYAESIDVPLIVKLPGARSGRRMARRVQQIDLLPTVLAVLGLEHGPEVEGRSLLPWMRGPAGGSGERGSGERAFSYLHLDGPARASVIDGGWKLIQQIEHGALVQPQLYRFADDPRETDNLAERLPIRAGYLAALLRGKLARQEHRLAGEAAVIDDELRRSLEALGYVD